MPVDGGVGDDILKTLELARDQSPVGCAKNCSISMCKGRSG